MRRRDLAADRKSQPGPEIPPSFAPPDMYRQDLNDRHAVSAGLSLEDIRYDMDFNAKLVACNDLDPECSTVDASYVSYRNSLDVLAHEGFVEDRWSITDRHALTFGLNYSGDDYLGGGRIEPRLRLDVAISDKPSTHAAAGQYSQLPQLREMIDVLGNPGLSRVKSSHYVWGVSQERRHGGELRQWRGRQRLWRRIPHPQGSDRSLVRVGFAEPVGIRPDEYLDGRDDEVRVRQAHPVQPGGQPRSVRVSFRPLASK